MNENTALKPLTETYESWSITTLRDNDARAWFLGKAFAAPLGVKPNAIRMQIADLPDEDKAVILIDTPGGRQKMTFVSESGALQIGHEESQAGCRQDAQVRLRYCCEIQPGRTHCGQPTSLPARGSGGSHKRVVGFQTRHARLLPVVWGCTCPPHRLQTTNLHAHTP